MTLYGQILDGTTLEAAAIETLKAWTPAYLAELCAQRGLPRDELKPFRSYSVTPTFTTDPETQLPALVLVSSGLLEAPVRQADGTYQVEWGLDLGVVCSARDRASTSRNVRIYTAAVRTLLLQHPTLGGLVTHLRWIDEDYDELAIEKSRSIQAGMLAFGATVPDVVNVFGGPSAVPEDPLADPGDWPIADEINETVTYIDDSTEP